MHGLMRGRWKSIGCKEEARGRKLPTEADRPELLCSLPMVTRHPPTLLEG